MAPTNCVFCQISSAKLLDPGLLSQDPDLLIKLSTHPQTKGHSLVIPNGHYQSLADIPEGLLAKLFKAAVLVGEAMKLQLGAKAYVIRVNDSLFKLEDNQGHIGHIHIHIIPRYKSGEKLLSKPIRRLDSYLTKIKSQFSILIKD